MFGYKYVYIRDYIVLLKFNFEGTVCEVVTRRSGKISPIYQTNSSLFLKN